MKTSFHYVLIGALSALLIVSLYSFNPAEANYEYIQISSVESIIPGGLGRSRLLTTDENGSLVEKDLKNFYSIVGINFGNIQNNDRVILDRVNEYVEDGWELVHVNSGVQSPTDGGKQGLYLTRYIFRRAK